MQRVIYHLLDQVAELMAGSAPRVEEEVVVGEAQVLQTFALKKGARCGVWLVLRLDQHLFRVGWWWGGVRP